MKIYLDGIFLINFIYDFIILLTSSIILKRNISIIRIIIGSLFGSLTIFILFIKLSILLIIIYKIIISILLILITFGFKDIRYFIKNIYYFYLISILLGGLIYFLNNSLSYSVGLIFFNSYKTNIILGLVLSFIFINIYTKSIKNLKLNNNKYINTTIYFNDYKVNVMSYVDTGNKLKDPYSFKPIILLDKKYVKEDKYILVPIHTCSGDSILKCIKPKKIFIEGIGYKNKLLVGITDSINIDGINCLLNECLMEG